MLQSCLIKHWRHTANAVAHYCKLAWPRSCRSVQQCFWESMANLINGFWNLTTLFADFRNCRSVKSNFTAQAHLRFPLSDDPVNRETSQEKPGKYHTWVGRQKYHGQKSPKSVVRRVCEWVTKSEPLTILSPLVRIPVISARTAASRSTQILLQDFIQMTYEGLAFT